MFTLIVVFYLSIAGRDVAISQELAKFDDGPVCEQVAAKLTGKEQTTYYCEGKNNTLLYSSGSNWAPLVVGPNQYLQLR